MDIASSILQRLNQVLVLQLDQYCFFLYHHMTRISQAFFSTNTVQDSKSFDMPFDSTSRLGLRKYLECSVDFTAKSSETVDFVVTALVVVVLRPPAVISLDQLIALGGGVGTERRANRCRGSTT